MGGTVNWDLVRHHGLRHTVLAGGAVVGLAYAASRAAGASYGLLALFLFGGGLLSAAFTAFGAGGAARGTAIEPAAPTNPGRTDLETGSGTRGALAVFFASPGVSLWSFGSMVVLGI